MNMNISKERFINHTNAKIKNSEIVITEYKNSNTFQITLTNNLIEPTVLIPSKELISIITDEAIECYGLDVEFNNINSIFWIVGE